jgi:hypothetical protein
MAACASFAESTSEVCECSYREPAQGDGGIRGEPMSRLTVPEQRRASVRMAPSRQGSVTRHCLADSAKIKTPAARAQARRRMRREVANAVKGCETAKDKGKWEAAGQGTVQCDWAQRRQEINRNMGAFAGCGSPGPAQPCTAAKDSS